MCVMSEWLSFSSTGDTNVGEDITVERVETWHWHDRSSTYPTVIILSWHSHCHEYIKFEICDILLFTRAIPSHPANLIYFLSRESQLWLDKIKMNNESQINA